MKYFSSLLALLLIHLLSNAQENSSASTEIVWQSVSLPTLTVFYTLQDSNTVKYIAKDVMVGEDAVVKFFAHPFLSKFNVFIFPDRKSFDEHLMMIWDVKEFHSECWMVGSGIGSELDLLSPEDWSKEACEHDAANREATQKLITHELVHLYHGQHNPNSTFAGMDSLGWMIEGVATYVSGQLNDNRIQEVKTAIASNAGPHALSKFFSGDAQYALTGTLVKYIDDTYGRATLFSLLALTDQTKMLQLMQTNEATLIAGWKKIYQ